MPKIKDIKTNIRINLFWLLEVLILFTKLLSLTLEWFKSSFKPKSICDTVNINRITNNSKLSIILIFNIVNDNINVIITDKADNNKLNIILDNNILFVFRG